ncbi:MAG: hypothetical protein AABZ55_01930, partial [Bdellovibrionota bacterium]
MKNTDVVSVSNRGFLIFAGLLSLLLAYGCESQEAVEVQVGESQVSATQVVGEVVDVAIPEPARSICDPFSGKGGPSSQQSLSQKGLHANLYYLSADQPRYSKVADYLSFGHKVDAELFFNQLNVPTRKFDLGFQKQDGALVNTLEGQSLLEWFALHFESR